MARAAAGELGAQAPDPEIARPAAPPAQARSPGSSALRGPIARWAEETELGIPRTGALPRYSAERGGPPQEAYRTALAVRVRSTLIGAADGQAVRLLAGGACEPFVEVTFGPAALDPVPGAGRRDEGSAGMRFEEGLVRVESVSCLEVGDVRPGDALEIYTSREFRTGAGERIRRIHADGEESCVETAGVTGLVRPTHVCNRIRRGSVAGAAWEHSEAVRNVEGPGMQPVYLKESLKTFVRIPGGLAVHHVHISRSADVGRLERWAAARSIRAAEGRKAEALAAHLRDGTVIR